MKIEIDTKQKKITISETAELSELIDELEKLLPTTGDDFKVVGFSGSLIYEDINGVVIKTVDSDGNVKMYTE